MSSSESDEPLAELVKKYSPVKNAKAASASAEAGSSDSDVVLGTLAPNAQTKNSRLKRGRKSESNDGKPDRSPARKPRRKQNSSLPKKTKDPPRKQAKVQPEVSSNDSDEDQPLTKIREKTLGRKSAGKEAKRTEDCDGAAETQDPGTPESSGSEEDGKQKEPELDEGLVESRQKTADPDTSDTSIEDRFLPASPKEKALTSKKQPNKEKKAVKVEEAPRIVKLKRYINTAGFRPNYKLMFGDCDGDKQKIAKAEEFLRSKGLDGNLSLDACQAFRLKKEQQKELADLDLGNIISQEERSSRSKTRRRPVQISESESEGSDSAAEEARQDCQEMLSRLKGIVDSDGDSPP